MTEEIFLAHMTQLNEAQKRKKVEDEVVVVAMKENVASIQAEVSTKAMDDTIVRSSLILPRLVS